MDFDMQCWEGLYLPKHERHLIDWMRTKNEIVDGKPTYQYHKLRRAMQFVKQHRVALDVGAHCGLWSMHLVRAFDKVHAFEPLDLHRRCFMLNVQSANFSLHDCALGAEEGGVTIYTEPTSSGDSYVSGEGSIRLAALDNFITLSDAPVDFIKLDCEGYEYFALRGGANLIDRCHPCILVEQKPRKAQKFGLGQTKACDFLLSLGAKLNFAMSGDYCFSWD